MIRLLAATLCFALIGECVAQDAPKPKGKALIVIGLPGDRPHRKEFADIARHWHAWLSTKGGFAKEDVLILGEDCGDKDLKALMTPTAEKVSLEECFKSLSQDLKEEDRFWLLMLGHGNHDGRRAYFHQAGPDLDDRQWQTLLKGIKCREQVCWLTFSASGWFLKSLSTKGRVVITATEPDNEFNDTEFPLALVDVFEQEPADLDLDKDGHVSVRELFVKTCEGVTALFEANKRLPTEHAQLDDSGDGKGTEAADLSAENATDGKVAEKIVLPE